MCPQIYVLKFIDIKIKDMILFIFEMLRKAVKCNLIQNYWIRLVGFIHNIGCINRGVLLELINYAEMIKILLIQIKT